MSLIKKTFNASLWAFVQNSSRQIISALVFFILVRFFLNKDDFGLVALSTVLITFLNVFVAQGLVVAIIQKQILEDSHINSAFWVNVFTSVILTSTVLLFSDAISVTMGDNRIAPIIQVLSAGMIITALGLSHEAILSRELNFKSLAIRTIVTSISSGVVGLSVAVFGGGLWSLVAMQLTMQISGLIVLWWKSEWRPKMEFSLTSYKELLPTSLSSTGIMFVSFINDFADQFIIGRFLGASSLGVYFVAQKIVKLVFIISFQSVVNILLPSFSMINGDVERTRNAMLKAMSVSSIFSFPIFLGLSVTSDMIVPLIFGDGWDDAIPVMIVLSVWASVSSVTYYFGPVLQALGKSNSVFINTIINVVSLIILCIVGSRYGLLGFSIAVLLTPLCTLPIWLYSLRKYVGVSFFMLIKACGKNLLSSLLMIVIVLSVRFFSDSLSGNVGLALVILIGIFSYALTSWLIAKKNILMFLSIVKQSALK